MEMNFTWQQLNSSVIIIQEVDYRFSLLKIPRLRVLTKNDDFSSGEKRNFVISEILNVDQK